MKKPKRIKKALKIMEEANAHLYRVSIFPDGSGEVLDSADNVCFVFDNTKELLKRTKEYFK